MAEKLEQVGRYWGSEHEGFEDYGSIDVHELRPFTASHPVIMKKWLATEAESDFCQDPEYRVTLRDHRNRIRFWIEETFGIEISKKHYRSLD